MARAPRLHRGGRGFEPLSAHQIQGVFIDTYPSPQQPSEVRARLYLDLDGVIYPIRRFSETEGIDPEDVDMLHEQADYEWWRKSVSRRLASLGMEIVMASSWGVSFMRQEQRRSPLRAIGPTRALETGLHLSKEEAVANDLMNDPAPFVWIDDDLDDEMIGYVKERIPSDLPGLYVKTYKMQGLTHDEITAIEKGFINQL